LAQEGSCSASRAKDCPHVLFPEIRLVMASRIVSTSGYAAHLNLRPKHDEDFDDEVQSLAFDVEGHQLGTAGAQKMLQTAQKRGTWAAQAMSLSALVLALISVCLLSMVALRLGGSGGATQPSIHDVIGLASSKEVQVNSDERGWYRTYLRTMVREGESLNSAEVELLPPGSLVWVAETKGRRARVQNPVKGWVSLRSTEGIEIMRPDTMYAGRSNQTEFNDFLKGPEMKNATKRLKEASAKLTALQAKMKDTLKKVTDQEIYKKVGKKSKEVGSVVQKKAPQLEQLAKQELKKVINTKGANDFFKSLAERPGAKEITSGARADAMAMKDMERLQASLQSSIDAAPTKAEASTEHLAGAAAAASDDLLHT